MPRAPLPATVETNDDGFVMLQHSFGGRGVPHNQLPSINWLTDIHLRRNDTKWTGEAAQRSTCRETSSSMEMAQSKVSRAEIYCYVISLDPRNPACNAVRSTRLICTFVPSGFTYRKSQYYHKVSRVTKITQRTEYTSFVLGCNCQSKMGYLSIHIHNTRRWWSLGKQKLGHMSIRRSGRGTRGSYIGENWSRQITQIGFL